MDDRVGQTLGSYQLLQPLGKGGFAEVYLAQHMYLRRKVALKVLAGKFTRQDVEDFLREAQIIAAFKHPHILSVFDFGMANHATPFLVMEYAANGTLRDRHRPGTQIPLSTVVSYVKCLASALQYAHNARVMHRDLKPENMLLDEHQTLLLSDFGLAAIAHHNTNSVKTLDSNGTPPYMAPEQFQGKPVVASDQYALAVVIYEWLCGVRPFGGDNYALAYQHQEVLPTPLHQLNPQLSTELDTVVLRALAKDPLKRYPSIQAFAHAFEQAAQQQSSSTKKIAAFPPRPPVTPGSRPILQASPALVPSPVSPTLLICEGHTDTIESIAWSPDGSRLASVSRDRSIKAWNVHNRDQPLLYSMKLLHEGQAVAWSPDSQWLASGDRERLVQIWDTQRASLICTHTCPADHVESVAWSPNGTLVASVSDGYVQIWGALSVGPPMRILRGNTDQPASGSVAWSPDGGLIAVGSAQHTVHIWNMRNIGLPAVTLSGPVNDKWSTDVHLNAPPSLSWSPDSRYLVSSSGDDSVYVWDIEWPAAPLLVYRGHNEHVDAVSWSPDGRHIASAARSISSNHIVHIWDALKGGPPLTGRFGTSKVLWSPDGKQLASVTAHVVTIWQM
ncbi:serine/threonine-protein kinase [Dictyobacter arantiisoli]|nr:serine/threonine-protein kinase [Dictyobacter arantiisoli]